MNTLLQTGHSVAIGQREHMGNPCMNNYTAADGRAFWILGLEGDRHWPPLCRAVGRAEWVTDARFDTARARATNATELIRELDAIFATKPLDEWAESLRRTGLLLVAHQLDGRRLGGRAFHQSGGIVYVPDGESTTPMVATPADFHGTPWARRGRAVAGRAHQRGPRRARDAPLTLSNGHGDRKLCASGLPA